jgi:hypothetical protein
MREPSSSVLPTGDTAADPGEGTMHPMFVELFMKTDADDLLAEEEGSRRRATRRPQRSRPAMLVRAIPRDRDRRPRR